MAKGTRTYAGCCRKGDERMHTRSEWLTIYQNLRRSNGNHREFMYYVFEALLMLVEDKIKEMQE